MGIWMTDITKQPTLAEMIEFARDASDYHLYWADAVVNDPYYSQLFNPDGSLVLGSHEFHEECALLHDTTADELEAIAKKESEKNPGCINLFKVRGG